MKEEYTSRSVEEKVVHYFVHELIYCNIIIMPYHNHNQTPLSLGGGCRYIRCIPFNVLLYLRCGTHILVLLISQLLAFLPTVSAPIAS